MAPKTKTNQVKEVAEQVVDKIDTVVEPEIVPVPDTVLMESVLLVSEVDKYSLLIDRLQFASNEVKEMLSMVKIMQKEHQKLQKQTTKKSKKNANGEVSKRSPSGFAKPTKLSNDLCDFLGVEHDTLMARTIVTKNINDYVKNNNLQDQTDKRHIIPNAKLNSILTLPEGDRLTYFNLQTYIKHHFKKDSVAVVV